jgi:hypothetical protein
VLGDMPKKTYDMKRMPFVNDPIAIPAGATAAAALDRVLKLPSVCSKRFLTTKVDRSVTGLAGGSFITTTRPPFNLLLLLILILRLLLLLSLLLLLLLFRACV